MRRVPSRRGPLLSFRVFLATFVAVSVVTVPAGAAPTAPGVTDAALGLGSAAVTGAGGAATAAVADHVQHAGVAVGAAAASVKPIGPAHKRTAVPNGPTWRWNGWVSGAAGPETVDGSFGTWRGEPLGLVGAWADQDAESQTSMSTVREYSGFRGEMDIAVGGLVSGETWKQAAAGQFVTRWTTSVRNLKALRGGKGTTYIRFAHEFNGDWMPWGVATAAEAEDYKKAYRRYASIVRKEFPQARLSWSPNVTHHSQVSIDDLWPGGDVVDVVAPDLYDFDTDLSTAASWKRESTSWLTPHSPNGIDAWRVWAARRGEAVGLGEWGLAAGDDPVWITQVHDYLAEYAAGKGTRRAAGRFVYDCYFNAESKFKLYGGPNPEAAAAYASLRWGS